MQNNTYQNNKKIDLRVHLVQKKIRKIQQPVFKLPNTFNNKRILPKIQDLRNILNQNRPETYDLRFLINQKTKKEDLRKYIEKKPK